MKEKFGFLFSLVLYCSALSNLHAQPGFDITSAKKAIVEDDVLYVAAGYPGNNHEGLQGQLQPLWDAAAPDLRTDSYNQPWREVPIADLDNVFGPMDMLYLAVFENQARVHEVRGAYIWQWGCDETSLIPVLDIGPYKFTKAPPDWTVVAFGVTAWPGEVEIRPGDAALIPADFHNPVTRPEATEIWINGQKHFTYLDRNWDEPDPPNMLVDHATGEARVLVAKSPLDLRC